MFWFGWEGFLTLQRIPEDAIQVDATARMWSWKFTYDSGKSSDKLYVPVGTPIKVKMVGVFKLASSGKFESVNFYFDTAKLGQYAVAASVAK